MAFIEITVFILVVTVILTVLCRNPPDYPPGPCGVPIFGNLIKVGRVKNFYNYLKELRSEYGDVFRLVMGQITMFFIFGHDNVNEVLVNNAENSMDRPDKLFVPQNINKKKGIVWTNGIYWKKQNELIMKAQIDKSVQKQMQTKLIEEALDVCQAFNSNTAADPVNRFKILAFSIVSILVFGKRYDVSLFKEMQTSLQYVLENGQTLGRKETFFSWMTCFTRSQVATVNEHKLNMYKFIEDMLEQHKTDYDQSKPRDLLDIYLALSEEERDQEYYSAENLYQSVVDLFAAGLDTYTSAMLSAVFLLAKYSDIQKKCRSELTKEQIGCNVTLDDRKQLPYFEAFIKEFLRLWKPVVLSIYRTNNKAPLKLGKYTIPTKSIILLDLNDPQIDPKLWENPDEFNPDRWLTENSAEGFIPWGNGPRQCVGTPTAKIALFLLLSNIIKKYEIIAENPGELTLEKEYTGVSVRPKPFKIFMTSV